ncbi:hypothetical protein [Sediminibacillus massiliensis]|uniref:hypothetical protein n=1 Tax=Sediminibacillus massiliensis TaxID=1926277 RepID=UPI001FECF006|nr:hypothetical protein [Sediminibacillus massiliensis]
MEDYYFQSPYFHAFGQYRGQAGTQPGIPGVPGIPGFPGPPAGPPPGQPGGGAPTGPPTSPPPSYVPQQQLQTFAVDPGGIRGCLFRFTYVWLSRFQSFWFYPTFVGRQSIAGYRWTGFNWVYFGIDLNRIESFQCV